MYRYTAQLVVFLLSLSSVTALQAAYEHLVGETEEAVRAELGEPEGLIGLGEKREKLLYAQGSVTLGEGIVTEVSMLSPEEFAQQEARRQEVSEYWQERQVQLEKEQKEAGERLREQTLENPEFLALPYEEQLRFWQQFKVNYPAVDVEEPYNELLAKYKALLEEEQKDRRLAQLKEQVAEAHERAAEAEQKAEEARRSRPNNFFYYSDPVYVSPYTAYHRNYNQGSRVSIGYDGGDWNFSLQSGSFAQPSGSYYPGARPITIIRTD